MLSAGGGNHYLRRNSMRFYVSNKNKQRRSQQLPVTSTDGHLFSSRHTAPVARRPCEQPSCPWERAQLQTSPHLLLGEAGRREKEFWTPNIHFKSNLQMVIYPKPTKCLRSQRKPKTESAPFLHKPQPLLPRPSQCPVHSLLALPQVPKITFKYPF